MPSATLDEMKILEGLTALQTSRLVALNERTVRASPPAPRLAALDETKFLEGLTALQSSR
jgi:hypothetical protein